MKLTLLIMLNKTITFICKLFKFEGSVFPASIVRKFDKNILEKIKYPKYVVGVTGSSGKGSTTSMIAHILEVNGYKVVWNKSGSNVVNGTTTLILNNTKVFSHKMDCDFLLLEMDESYIKETFSKSTLTHLVVTNITRDQPARNGEPMFILNKIFNSIDEKTHLIINSDDAFVNRLKYLHKGEVTTYGIGKTKYSLKEPISNNVDAAYCPICHENLVYKFYHYGHLGSYSCPNGDFKNNIDIKAEKVDLEKQEMVINDNIIHLNKDVFFAVYYTLAAYSLCKVIGMEEVKIIHALNDEVLESKRLKSLKYHNREVDMLESKNENNLSYLQSLNYINNYKGKKTIILGFDNVSRRYKYNDISWLYDVDFEVLDLKNIDKILCIGRFRYDVYARLRLANIDEDKLVIVDNIKNISEDLDKTEGTIFTMVCFDMTAVLKKIFMEDNND
ncbi:MAG: MurT ligase domain-containing protein [Bacilli bacterium]|nr:MurT ligase domain-containing protein [Bacilli bacterium]